MQFRLIPVETVIIETGKSTQEILNTLRKSLGKTGYIYGQIFFSERNSGFVIQWKLQERNRTIIVAHGVISEYENKTELALHVAAEARWLPVFVTLWYGLLLLFSVLMLIASIRDNSFSFAFLVPLLFVLLGYGFTTLSIQGAIDQLIEEIKRIVALATIRSAVD